MANVQINVNANALLPDGTARAINATVGAGDTAGQKQLVRDVEAWVKEVLAVIEDQPAPVKPKGKRKK